MVKCPLFSKLEESELVVACKYSNYDILLKPMKDEPKLYRQQSKKLGNMDKKSKMVKAFLPKIAVSLALKDDTTYVEIIERILCSHKERFEFLCKALSPVVTNEELISLSEEKQIQLYFEILSIDSNVSSELYYVYLRLCDVLVEDKVKNQLDALIKQCEEEKEKEEAEKKEREKEIKLIERKLQIEFEKERADYKSEIEKIRRELRKKTTEYEELLQEKDKLEKQLSSDRERLVKEWEVALKKESEEKRKKIQTEMAAELAEKKKKNEVELEGQREQIIADIEMEANNHKQAREAEIDSLKRIIEEQKEIKENNERDIEETSSKLDELQLRLEQLQKLEEQYFEKFDERVMNRRIDSLLFDKIPMQNSYGSRNKNYLSNRNCVNAYEVEETEDAQDIQDLFQDIADNISILFTNYYDIASLIIAAVAFGKGIIVADSIGMNLAESLALICTSGNIYELNILSDVNPESIISEINNVDAELIYINGVLDRFDEALYIYISKNINKRIVLWGISDMKNLRSFNKNIYNYSIVLDVENYCRFPQNEKFWFGKSKIIELVDNTCYVGEKIYNAGFLKLVSKGIIKQKTALIYSQLFELYYFLLETKEIGNVASKLFRYICEDSEDDLESLLEKFGERTERNE